MMARRRFPRPSMVMLPNGFTLGNLFFGIYAIVLASRGEHVQAGWCIVLGGFCDAIDGRIARATNSGSPFGEELDSLVDAISFGLAPALMIYFAELNRTKWDWIFVFLFAACAVMRLARFNIEQAGAETKAKYFTGLPSPAAGGTLATYYWFSQTPLYGQLFADWPWETILRWLMLTLSFLMISNVPYRSWPRFSVRTLDGFLGLLLLVASIVALFVMPREFFFTVGVSYVIIDIVMAVLRGIFDLPNPLAPEGESDLPEESLP